MGILDCIEIHQELGGWIDINIDRGQSGCKLLHGKILHVHVLAQARPTMSYIPLVNWRLEMRVLRNTQALGIVTTTN